jgi:hypothetical protein
MSWLSDPYRSPYRDEEARFDAMVEDWTLREVGVIEDDEPTAYSHHVHMQAFHERATGDFTREERATVRAQLGLGPWA